MNEDSLYNRLAKGILTDEEIDNLVDEIMNIPSEKNNNCVSTYGSINVDDLISNVKEFKKIPTFDNLLKENKTLKQQLDYLRSGEYHNQLRFERDMLQHIVDYNEVSKEDKEFIDMTHRNTELLEENHQLKEIHDKAINFIKNHIQETTYKYVYSNEVSVIQELHLDNEELIELLKILERSDNN